jgi:integrase
MHKTEKLSDITIRRAAATGKLYKLMDGGGLCVQVSETGSKLWRFNYRFAGTHKTLALGKYPQTSLSDARIAHKAARKLIETGIDPSEERKNAAKSIAAKNVNTLSVIAEEWLSGPHAAKVIPRTLDATKRLITANVLDSIGHRPITDITAPELLSTLRNIEARGVLFTAHRAAQICGQIWRFAIATGRAERNIVPDLKGSLIPFKEEHRAAILDPTRLGDLLRAIDTYTGSPLTVAALKLTTLLMVRPGELRHAKWADIDLDAAEWRFTATKTNTPHIVLLARQAIAALQDIWPISGHLEYVFPGVRNKHRPMSENTVNAALRYMGFEGDEVVAHGLSRATSRTLLDETLEKPVHLIEHQLAHKVKDANGNAYNRTKHLEQRRVMLQEWADYLDGLKAGGKVLQFKAA